MAVAINMPHPVASPLDAIAKGLEVAKGIYGIQHDSAALDLLKQQSAAEQAKLAQANDPDSAASQLGRAQQIAFLDASARSGDISKESASKLAKLISGSPAVPGTPDRQMAGPVRPGEEMPTIPGTPDTPAIPGMTQSQLSMAMPEGSALVGFVKGKQAADASALRTQAMVGPKWQAQYGSINSAIENHPVIQNANMSDASLNKANNLLSESMAGRVKMTPQRWSEINKDVANALTGGSNAAQGDTARQEIQTGQTAWSGLMQKVTNDATDINSPQLLKDAQQGIDQIQYSIRNNRAETGHRLAATLNPAGNPEIQSILDTKTGQYDRDLFNSPEYKRRVGAAQSGTSEPSGGGAAAQFVSQQNAKGAKGGAAQASEPSGSIHPDTVSAAQAELARRRAAKSK